MNNFRFRSFDMAPWAQMIVMAFKETCLSSASYHSFILRYLGPDCKSSFEKKLLVEVKCYKARP